MLLDELRDIAEKPTLNEIDASAVVALVLGDERSAPAVRARLREAGKGLHAPHLLDLEVAGAVRRKLHMAELRHVRAQAAIDLLRRLRCTRYPHGPLLSRAWELRDELTVYDAAYVALAESLAAPLLTLDAKLARAAQRHVAAELLARG